MLYNTHSAHHAGTAHMKLKHMKSSFICEFSTDCEQTHVALSKVQPAPCFSLMVLYTTSCSLNTTACVSNIHTWSRAFIWTTVHYNTHNNSPSSPLCVCVTAGLSFTASYHHVAHSPAHIWGAAHSKEPSDLKRWSHEAEQHFTLQWTSLCLLLPLLHSDRHTVAALTGNVPSVTWLLLFNISCSTAEVFSLL